MGNARTPSRARRGALMDFMPPLDEKIFTSPLFVATESELSARRVTDVSPLELTVPRLLPFGSPRFWLFFPDDPLAIERRARAFSDPIESDRGSSFLLLRVFLTRTCIHFAEKRSSADQTGHRDRLSLLCCIKWLCGLKWDSFYTDAEIRRPSGLRAFARVARARRLQEAGRGSSKRKQEWSGWPGRETHASCFCSTLDYNESTKALAWPYTSANFPSGVRHNRRSDWFEQPMEDAVRLWRRGTVSLVAW